MTSKFNLGAIIVSAGLMTGSAGLKSEEIKAPIERTKESTLQVLSGKENMKQLRLEIEKNSLPYQVQKNDTIASIANRAGISTDELLDLNAFLDTSLIRRGKNGNNILIKPGQSILIPKNADLFHTHIERMSEYARVGKLNQKVEAGKINEIAIEPIFASSVRSIGLPNCLTGFVESQKMSYDPNLPRVVDRSREKQVTCANAMRTLMAQCMNITDLSPKEQAFQRKQNVDAWMLPTELMKIDFEQKFGEIMGMFEPSAIGGADPIKKDKIGEYRETIKSMNTYMEENGDALKGSFVPYYFKRSHYKGVVADYNQWRKDKHYNTHQSMFAGNATISFGAWNVPLIREGKMESFGLNKKDAIAEIERLGKEIIRLESQKEENFKKLLASAQSENNPEINKRLQRHERVIEPLLRSPKAFSDEEKAEKRKQLVSLLQEWNETKQDSTIEKIQKVIPHYKITPEDLEYLGSFVSNHQRIKYYVNLFQKSLSSGPAGPIDTSNFGATITGNTQIQQAVEQYNTSLSRLEKTKTSLTHKQELLEKPQEDIPVIDFIVNFIQSRADFGGSLSEWYRKEIYNGLSLYGDILHIKINGKTINVPEELALYKSDKKKGLRISPEDTFEISGPLMIDGEKQSTHKDISRQKSMNIRTRFFFEFFLSETYLPSELLVPGEKSSFSRHEFTSHSGKLNIKGIYGLRMKYSADGEVVRNKYNQPLSENIEEVLLREIATYENISLDDPKRTEKLRRYYALQIKALQIAGFLQDENTLNRSAVNINRAIPYFDPININEVFSSYIRTKKQEMHEENKRLSELKSFIDIRTLPGDTYRQIFSSVVRYASTLGEASEAYPYIQNISRLPDYKKRIFVERFLSASSREKDFDARKFLASPKPYKSFILSLESLESLLIEIAEMSYTPSFPWLSETDKSVIELVTADESYRQMLANILATESYGKTREIFTRENAKRIANKIWFGSSLGDYQLRISILFADLENDKVLESSLTNLIKTFKDPEVQSFLQSFEGDAKKETDDDLKHVQVAEKIIRESKNSTIPKKAIIDELSAVMRFDDWDGSNVVSKLISASLLIDKLALHSEKLDYMLVSAGYDLSAIFDNPTVMQQYERAIIRTNNLPENHMLLALAENFILRISEKVTETTMPTKSVFDDSYLSKGKYLGQIQYNKKVFLSHLKEYRTLLEKEEEYAQSRVFLKKLDELINNMEIHPTSTNENIYTFLRDKELRAFLEGVDINPLPIPLADEWNKGAFRHSVFHYVNKIDVLRKRKLAEKSEK